MPATGAAALCAIPVIAGNLLGIAISMGLLQMVNALLGSNVAGRHQAVFGYHPLVLILTLLVTVITIWISAWLPAKKLSSLRRWKRLENTGELQLKAEKEFACACIFVWHGRRIGGKCFKSTAKGSSDGILIPDILVHGVHGYAVLFYNVKDQYGRDIF